MFQELMPLLAQRTLMLMISRLGADEIRINIIPQRLQSEEADSGSALTTPLTVSGTPKELDEVLPSQLLDYVGAHLGLSSTLKSAKEQMEAAAKAAREAARKTSVGKPANPTKSIPAPENVAPESPVSTAVPLVAPPEQLSGSLFSEPTSES